MPTGIYKRNKETIEKLLNNSGNPKGHKLSIEQKKKHAMFGNKNPMFGKHTWNYGKKGLQKHSITTRKKISETNKRLGRRPPIRLGIEHHNWKGGISNNPYPKEFTIELKLKIRKRDNFTCCLCRKTEREELEELNRVLCVNHIDFNKNNCSENNLNTLCLKCNIKINRERDYWTNYFNQNI